MARSCFQGGGNKVKEHIKPKWGLGVFGDLNMQAQRNIKTNDSKKKEALFTKSSMVNRKQVLCNYSPMDHSP